MCAVWLCEGPRSDFWMSHAGCSPEDAPLEGGQVAKASSTRFWGKGRAGKHSKALQWLEHTTAAQGKPGLSPSRTMTGGGPCQWHPSHPRAQPALEQPPPPRKTFRLPWRLSKRPAGRARQRRDAGGRGAPGSRAGLQPQLSSRCAPLETCCTAKFCLRTAAIRWEGREHPPAAPPPPHCPSSPFFFFFFASSPPHRRSLLLLLLASELPSANTAAARPSQARPRCQM